MNDQTTQDPQAPTNSYVDEYVPPTTNDANLVDVPLDDKNTSGVKFGGAVNNSNPDPIVNPVSDSSNKSNSPQFNPIIIEDDDEIQNQDQDQHNDDFSKALGADTPNTKNTDVKNPETVDTNTTGFEDFNNAEDLQNHIQQDTNQKNNPDEEIETQNIFMMLGVEAGDDDLKEKFLDQLQDVIWDDFLENDVELLLSEEEMGKFKTFKEKVNAAQGEDQERAKDKMVEFLEGLIPDLEDIMLEKALDLKADLFTERIDSMKEYYADKPDQLSLVTKAEELMYEDNWKSAAMALNNIK